MAVVGTNLDPVAMAPSAREFLEVTRPQTAAIGIVPEKDRHGWKGRGQDKFSHLIQCRLAVFIPRLDRSAEPAALQFTGMQRQEGIAEDEGGADIRAATGRPKQKIALHVIIDPAKTFRRKWRAGRSDGS